MGTGDNEGTEMLVQADPGIAWMLPNSYSTSAVGVWKKTGPRTYKYTGQGYIVERAATDQGSVNAIRFIGISSGVKTVTSCDRMEAVSKLESFWPDGTPVGFSMIGTVTAQRLVVVQTAPLPQ